MPKPWEYSWSSGGDPSGLNLLPIMPFLGRQRPPMLGEGGQPNGPAPMPVAGPYAPASVDPMTSRPAGSFDPTAAGYSALAAAGPASGAGAALALPSVAPPPPFDVDPVAQPSTPPPSGTGATPFLHPQFQPPPAVGASSAQDLMPQPDTRRAQSLLQPAVYDGLSVSSAPSPDVIRPSQVDSAPAGVTLAQGRTTLEHGVPDMMPQSALIHGNPSRRPGTQDRRSGAATPANANIIPFQPQQPQSPVPDLFDAQRGWNRGVWYDRIEHIGEHSNSRAVSHRGAFGPMQLMPLGAIDGARYLRIPLDMGLARRDPDYNRMIGRGYLDYLQQVYHGDTVLATAAYNLGFPTLNRLIRTIGDPRQGQISDWDFVWRLGVPETRDYVLRVVYGETRPQQAERRRQEDQQRQLRRRPPRTHQ